ncbi:endosome-associated-trafficking regulator 1 [Fundulus heteroclitus]|uniref:endosome-associated-trafficking regulator 1 n=1 Tax=Fundulus heteroclitus TaxID=8078 RepID=UPI00165A9681|nr:endosome-associated-trafficking regulator 1 [Fundulus heteroclitus]
MSRRSGGKNLIITDDEEEEQEELNPFSFKEFLRWKNQNQNQDHTHSKPGSDVSSDFLSEAHLAAQEEDLGRSFQSLVDSSSSVCTNEEEEEEEDDEEEETRFSSKPEGAAGGENYEGDDETSISEAAGVCRGRSVRSSQLQQLKEENSSLRRTLKELQRRADGHQRRAAVLSEELLQRRRQEEKEAQDLESMVHSVEQNLQLMTRRALKAENAVSRLKAELQQLQVEADALQTENNRLKAAESQVVMTMRQNAQVASEYLSKSASHAHSSLRQLLEEAETFRLVSQLLQSIEKISSVHPEP